MAGPANRFIYRTATTLDGFIADSENSLEWLFATPGDDTQLARADAFYADVGAVVEGSTTYEWLLEHENLLAEPAKWQTYFEDRPTFVFTTRELPVPDGADVRFLSGDVTAALAVITAAAGERNVWLAGGGALVAAFDAAGALDVIEVSIAPVTLGAGAPLLSGRIESERLELVWVRREGQFVAARYAVRRVGSPP